VQHALLLLLLFLLLSALPVPAAHPQVLFDVQAASIKPGSERSLFSGSVEVAGVTRRYAALAASCLTLMADHDSDDSEWY
jgi:hypothetical protein